MTMLPELGVFISPTRLWVVSYLQITIQFSLYFWSCAVKARCITLFTALLVGAVSTLCFTNLAGAQTYTWDASGGTATTPPSDGGGTWDTSTGTNWWNGSDNLWPTAGSPCTAVFGADNGAAGMVTVNSVTANALTFNPAGSGNYTLSSGTITLAGANATITSNADATISTAWRGAVQAPSSSTARAP